MSILSSDAPAERAAKQITAIIRRTFNMMADNGQQGFNLLWNNPDPEATPAAIITAFGPNAEALLLLARLNIQTVDTAAQIGGIDAPEIPSIPPQYDLNFDSAGNGILTTKASPDSSSSSSDSEHTAS